MKSVLFAASLSLGLVMPAEAQLAQQRGTPIRFADMDRNGDREISRQEWRGNDRSFRNHDWNGDGKLSGDEVRVGARRANRWDDRDLEASIDREDDWTAERFAVLDHDRDGRLTRSEWHATPELFSRIDRNRDSFLSRAEFLAEADDDREDQFVDLDDNRDGRISRTEWHGSGAVFDALDDNRDGTLTRAEAVGTEGNARDEFKSVDVNGDGAIARAEWHWNAAAFDRLDVNKDNRLSRMEFEGNVATILPSQSNAYRAGYERGRQDGIQAGTEDKPRGWDLEGQRELETADAGYQPVVGDRAEYQAAYRSGFRRGYREGFGERSNR